MKVVESQCPLGCPRDCPALSGEDVVYSLSLSGLGTSLYPLSNVLRQFCDVIGHGWARQGSAPPGLLRLLVKTLAPRRLARDPAASGNCIDTLVYISVH